MRRGAANLSLRGVRAGFPRRPNFLGPVTVDLEAGRCWAIVGPNGAGKSTLLRVMAGLLAPSEGDITIGGKPLRAWSVRERAKLMALVPQTVTSDIDLTVRETVLMGRYPHRSFGLFESGEDIRVAERVLALTGMAAFSDRTLATLSGGEAQRVHIAAALGQTPSILLLDEPTASLDLRYQLSIFGLLRDTVARESLTVVVVTHDVNLAARFCTDVIVLDDGQVAAVGPPKAVLTPALLSRVFGVEMVSARDEASGTGWLAPIAGGDA